MSLVLACRLGLVLLVGGLIPFPPLGQPRHWEPSRRQSHSCGGKLGRRLFAEGHLQLILSSTVHSTSQQRAIDSLFQAIAVRNAGFSIVALSGLSPAVQFLFVIMM